MTAPALPTYTWTIETAKGSCTGTVWEVCRWQAEHQGSFAKVTCAWSLNGDDWSVEIDVDGIDFDPDDLKGAVTSLRNGRDWEADALYADRGAHDADAGI